MARDYYRLPDAADGRYHSTFTPKLNASCLVTTWTGRVLGRIIAAKVTRHNFGGRMVSMRVEGTNGATYYGRASWDNGQVIRLRRGKV